MDLYSDCGVPVRPEVADAHAQTLDSFSRPGTWWRGPERTEIVAESRRARIEAGLQEADGFTDQDPGSIADLPEAVRRVAREAAVSPKDIGRDFYDGAVPEEMSDAEYVEVIGVVARAVDLDVFARGLGLPMAAVAAPKDGEPSRERPENANDDIAFAPMIHNGRRGGETGKAIYGENMMPNIIRATSLVPDECRGVMAIAIAQYVPLEAFLDMSYCNHPSVNRTQMELVAARVSAINECFY